jgi:hypothetical protein
LRAQFTCHRPIYPGQAPRAKDVRCPVAKRDLDAAAVHEVELFLDFVFVKAGLKPGRQHNRVDAEGGYAELGTYFVKARSAPQRVQ